MTSVMGQKSPPEAHGETLLGEVVGTPDHSKLEEQADRNLMNFSKKCGLLYLGLVSSMG